MSSQEKPRRNCAVCDAPKASIYHGGLTCISCRSFFVRAARQVKVYKCKNGGDCDIIADSESISCKACRYRKCLEAGMNIELIPSFKKRKGEYTKHAEGLIQRHVEPAISLGYKFIATATNSMSAIKCAQFYSSIDKQIIARGAFTESLRPFTLHVPLAHVILDSNYCFTKKEIMEVTPAEAVPLLIPHNYARSLADVIDFVTAIPEFVFLPQADKIRLLQSNYPIVATLRAASEFYWDPEPSELQATLSGQICALSKHTSRQMQMFWIFMSEHGIPIFNEVKIIKEEVALLLLIACFTPSVEASDKGRLMMRTARNKYLNVLKSFHQEMLPHLSDEEKVNRFRLLLDFMTHLQHVSLGVAACFSAQVVSNADSMLGILSYDLHIRVYKD